MCRRDGVNMAQSVPNVRGGVASAFVVLHLKALAAGSVTSGQSATVWLGSQALGRIRSS